MSVKMHMAVSFDIFFYFYLFLFVNAIFQQKIMHINKLVCTSTFKEW